MSMYPNVVRLSMANVAWTNFGNPSPYPDTSKPIYMHFALPGADATHPICGEWRCLVDKHHQKIPLILETIVNAALRVGHLQAIWGMDIHYYTLCDQAGRPFDFNRQTHAVVTGASNRKPGVGNRKPSRYIVPSPSWPQQTQSAQVQQAPMRPHQRRSVSVPRSLP